MNKIEQAVSAIQEGDINRGRKLLVESLRQEPRNAQAWLWMSRVVDDPAKKRESLLIALEIDPANQSAQEELARLEEVKLSSATSTPSASTGVTTPAATTDQQVAERWLRIAIASGGLFVLLTLCLAISFAFGMRHDRIAFATAVSENESKALAANTDEESSLDDLVADTDLLEAITPAPTSALNIPPTNTPGSLPPTPTVPATSCRTQSRDYLVTVGTQLDRISETGQVLTDNFSLDNASIVADDLKNIRDDLESASVPQCAQSASGLIISGITNLIVALEGLEQGAGVATFERALDQSQWELQTGLDQLTALAEGRPTPTPGTLPTLEPLPTPIPTAAPQPVGSAIQVDDWLISVTEVEMREEISVFDSVIKPAGRFALVFLDVTNQGLRPEDFIAIGLLEVVDDDGRRFEPDGVATFDAYELYRDRLDLGSDINPDETANVVVVFDVSEQSEYYVLGPGLLADPHSRSVYLPLP